MSGQAVLHIFICEKKVLYEIKLAEQPGQNILITHFVILIDRSLETLKCYETTTELGISTDFETTKEFGLK